MASSALRRALAASDLTSEQSFKLADSASEAECSSTRELAAAHFWASAILMGGALATGAAFERLCVLATDGESWFVRRRALSLLGALPTAVSAELIDCAINKRAAFSVMPKPPPPAAAAKKKGKRPASQALDGPAVNVEELVVGSDADRRAQAAAAAVSRLRAGAGFADPPPDSRAVLREAMTGAVQLGLEDSSSAVREAAVNTLADLVWPHGTDLPPSTPPGRAIGLLLDSANDESMSVRHAALTRLVRVAPKMVVRAPQLHAVCMCAADMSHDGCALEAIRALSIINLRDRPALDAAHTGLAHALRARSRMAEHVSLIRQAARNVGGRHVAMVLGRAHVGLMRQAARCAAPNLPHGPTAEQVVAFDFLRGAEAAKVEATAAEAKDPARASTLETLAELGTGPAHDDDATGDVAGDADPLPAPPMAAAAGRAAVARAPPASREMGEAEVEAAAAEEDAATCAVAEVEMVLVDSGAGVQVDDEAHTARAAACIGARVSASSREVARLVFGANRADAVLPWLPVRSE